MEDDNEILDWGNEDDEHHETLRNPPSDIGQRDTGELDAEDSISLGDEDEDNQEYPSYRSEGTNGHSYNARDITESQLRASSPQKTLLGTGAKQELQNFSGETTHEKPSTPHKSIFLEDSPRRKQDSRGRSSPQRSQPNPGRLTHALPPKPVTAKVPPYLPPSHPSIVEATSMIISPRAGGRESKKSNGVPSSTSLPSTADELLPHNWEYREARNGAGKYYYNKETHKCTWEKPVSSIPSASSHAESRSRRRSSSTGRRQRTPPDSNPHQSQTTRTSRKSVHMPLDDAMKTATPDLTVLSYDDRHYRPGGNTFSAVIEIRATERLSEVVNSHVSSQSRYERMPPASPPPSRRRARSPSPHESRASYLHEKDKEFQSSRGNSHSTRGQNAYTNDPQRDFESVQPDPGYAEHRRVRPPHPLDFPRSDRDSSRRRGRRQDDDEPMVDEHPDGRNRSSLRRRERSHEPNRERDLPPRPSELREDANHNPIFLSAPRRGSTPLARDRDQYYEPLIRDYRDPPEEDPRSTAPSSSRKDRSLRPDRLALPPAGPTINVGPEVRPRDRDRVPSPMFTHSSRRVSEREYDRNRREQQIQERDELPRRPVEYPPPTNQILEQQSKRQYDREPSRPHPSNFERSSPERMGQSSHRKRAPLPPQATTFLTSSTMPVYARDAAPHSSAAPVAPRSFRLPEFNGPDGNVPLAPRSMKLPPRPGGAEYDRDRGKNPSRQLDRVSNNYLTPLPLINTSMDVDDEGPLSTTRNVPKQYQEEDVESPRWPSSHPTTGGSSRPAASPVSPVLSGPENSKVTGRTSSTLAPVPSHMPSDGYSETRDLDRSRQEEPKEERMDRGSGSKTKSGVRSAEYMRPLAQPSLPPLVVAASLPPGIRYNPDARPPPSTLIDPAKARELLPPGKESYERPADLEIADTLQVRTANDASIHNKSRPSESSDRQPAAAIAPGKPRQRKSRFDKPVTQLEPSSNARERSPISEMSLRASQSDASDIRAATPTPLSREHSVVASMEKLSSRLSDAGQQSDARSETSSMVAVPSDARIGPPVTEPRTDQPLLNRFSKDPIMHEHLMPENQPQYDYLLPPPPAAHPPGSSRFGHRSGKRSSNDGRGNPQSRILEQPHHLPAAPDPPTSLSHRLSDDKSRHRQHPSSGGLVSGRDENSRGEGELSFHNAATDLEEEMPFQERLERPQVQRRGASLLDRLSAGNSRSQDSGAQQQSLRDRIIPSKRDREDMVDEGIHDVSFDGEEGTESKRARRKNGRARTRGGRRS